MAQDQGKMLRDRFDELNTDGTGVSQKDVRALLVDQGGWKAADVDVTLREATGGTDARIDTNTFRSIVRVDLATPTEQSKRMLDAFKALDTDDTGFITEAELRQLLLNWGDSLTSPEVEELMKEVTVDSEGRVSYDSYVAAIVTGYPLASA
ncbi:EF-hand domain-containing protein [Streptomyces sp. NBC_00250]|uniref:EF-hand domain-containing protein n=1 Tax=Streptomyces sp. NBC_00250 TaxID=2903641 RepID=UPI002E286772|nr:EF-hand domain-containing protein [Streptomyces sp. NBC_00250]